MFRCELCDNYLPIFQTGRLCETCYKIRTIIKCYTAKAIHSHISSVFLVDIEEDEEEDNEKDIKELRKNKSCSSIGDETYKPPPIKAVMAEMKTRNQKKKNKN